MELIIPSVVLGYVFGAVYFVFGLLSLKGLFAVGFTVNPNIPAAIYLSLTWIITRARDNCDTMHMLGKDIPFIYGLIGCILCFIKYSLFSLLILWIVSKIFTVEAGVWTGYVLSAIMYLYMLYVVATAKQE